MKRIVKRQKILFLIGFFISFNFYSQNDTKIKKIEFSTRGYASAPDFELIIFSDKTIVFIAEKDNYKEKVKGEIVPFGVDQNGVNVRESEVKGVFKTKVKNKVYKEILSLIKPLKIEFMEKTYSKGTLHSSYAKLKVTFKNGEIKRVSDDGMIGTEHLIQLYKYFKELRFSLKWE